MEYFHKIVVCLRYDDGLQEELTEVGQIVQMELKVVPFLPEHDGQMAGLTFRRQSWVGIVSRSS